MLAWDQSSKTTTSSRNHLSPPPSWPAFDFFFCLFWFFFRFIMMGCGRDVAGFRLFRLSSWNSFDCPFLFNYILRLYDTSSWPGLVLPLRQHRYRSTKRIVAMDLDGWMDSVLGWKGRGGIVVNCLLFSHLEEKPPKKNTKKETLTTFLLNVSLSPSLCVIFGFWSWFFC